MMRSGLQVPDFKPELVLKAFTEKAVELIDNHDQQKPFFLYMPLNSPHTPVLPRDEFKGSSRAGVYGDFVQETDWSVGEILKALDANGMAENTLIIFTADNGASRASFPLELEAELGHNPSHIYRGRKGSLDEGGHRVPFIARWPAGVEAKSTADVASNLNDLYATCADIVNADIATDAGEDSYSFLPLLKGKADEYQRDRSVHHDFSGRFAYRRGDWKYIPNPNPKKARLHHLGRDISEKENIIADNPEVVEVLKKELSEIIANGRQTPGPRLSNEGPLWWEQITWINEEEFSSL
jgi:arylsulfatase A-like enzyme